MTMIMNFNLKMEQEECRLRLARLYKLTPDEADDLIREATDHLRRERLKQVRNQSRQISKKTLRNVKDAERKAFQEMRNGFLINDRKNSPLD